MCAFLTSTRECGLSENCQFGTHPWYDKIFQRFEECYRVFSTLPITDPPTCQVLTKSCFAFSCSGWVGGSPALAIAQIFCIFCTRRAFLAPGFVSGWVNLLIFVFHLDSTQGICNFWFFLKEELVYTFRKACLTELLTTSLWLLRWWLCSAQGWFLQPKSAQEGTPGSWLSTGGVFRNAD